MAERELRKGGSDAGVIVVLVVVAAVVVAGLAGAGSRQKTVTENLPDAQGDMVGISGSQREVDSIREHVTELQAWAKDARRWFERYKESQNTGEQLVVEKCVRDINRGLTDTIKLCEDIRSRELIQVTGVASLVTGYEAFASEMLEAVKGR